MAMSVTYGTINGQLVYENRGGVETQYMSDPQGSLIGCMDVNENITYEAWYWPYGEVRKSTGTNPSPWGYIGLLGYLTDIANMLYVRARYYRPDLTRWLTVDPLWPEVSGFVYVRGGPTKLVDPSGLLACRQAPNPCSQIPDKLNGACIALLCSAKSVYDLIQDIKGRLGEEISELLRDAIETYINKPGGPNPQDCCRQASSPKPPDIVTSWIPFRYNIIGLIAWLCHTIRTGKSTRVCVEATKGLDDNKCYSCCEHTFTSNLFIDRCKAWCAGGV